MAKVDASVKPPARPWKPLAVEAVRGCLSYYISDDLSRVPIRAVTKVSDNKSDPNVETRTYGLFSVCERAMRAGVVKNGISHILFITKWHGRRVLSGFYRVAWYCEHPSAYPRDYALAADEVRFVDPPIPLEELPEEVRQKATRFFRLYTYLDSEQTAALLKLLETLPDRTPSYLAEIDRLERFNERQTGFRCWNETTPFTWEKAAPYLLSTVDAAPHTMRRMPNSSPSDHWVCTSCGALVENTARLRLCPSCRTAGSIQPWSERTEEAEGEGGV